MGSNTTLPTPSSMGSGPSHSDKAAITSANANTCMTLPALMPGWAEAAFGTLEVIDFPFARLPAQSHALILNKPFGRTHNYAGYAHGPLSMTISAHRLHFISFAF